MFGALKNKLKGFIDSVTKREQEKDGEVTADEEVKPSKQAESIPAQTPEPTPQKQPEVTAPKETKPQ
ncbi:MAG: hypothetical protein V1834_01305, partial [Candidatus Micrarchaeota archaeon]